MWKRVCESLKKFKLFTACYCCVFSMDEYFRFELFALVIVTAAVLRAKTKKRNKNKRYAIQMRSNAKGFKW